jgi:Concanavalin A-like lectin/glucanases superfamily
MVKRRTALLSTVSLAGSLGLYLACSVGPVDYSNKACDDGACPLPWRCVGGVCRVTTDGGSTDGRSGTDAHAEARAADAHGHGDASVDAPAPRDAGRDTRGDGEATTDARGDAEATRDAGRDATVVRDAEPDAPSYYAQVLADSPVLYLRFGEHAGEAAVDSSGHHYDGTYSDSGVVYGAVGAIAHDPSTAVTLNGQLGVGVAMPPGLDFAGTSPFTLEVWVKQTSSPGYSFILDHDDHAKLRAGWDLLYNGGTGMGPDLERWNDAGTTSGSDVAYAMALSMNVYHYVVATCDGAQLALYIDGEVGGLNATVDVVPVTGIAWFVGNQSDSNDGVIGSIDELAIYDHALDAGTVHAHFLAAQ